MDTAVRNSLMNMLDNSIRIFQDIRGVDADELMSANRKADVAIIRYMIWLQMISHCHCTTSEIGELFNRHHATVLYGIKKMRDIIRQPQGWKEEHQLYYTYDNKLWRNEQE